MADLPPWEAEDLRLSRGPMGEITEPQNTAIPEWEQRDLAATPKPRQNDTLGGNIPARSPYGSAATYYEPRYQAMGPVRRARAGIQNIISSIPVVRSIPGAQFISPPEDVEIARGARPFLSGAESLLGHSAPYTVVGAGLPNLMSTLPRAAAMSAGIEGADALAGKENVPAAMLTGAASVIPGAIAGKIITPRTVQGVRNVNIRASRDASILASGRDVPGIELQPWSLGITRHPMIENPIAGAILATQLGAHPVHGAIAGLAPELARQTAQKFLTMERRGAILDPWLYTSGGAHRPIDALAYRYGTNQVLSPQARALLNAIAGPAVNDLSRSPSTQ